MVLQERNMEQSTPGAGGQWVGFIGIRLPLREHPTNTSWLLV